MVPKDAPIPKWTPPKTKTIQQTKQSTEQIIKSSSESNSEDPFDKVLQAFFSKMGWILYLLFSQIIGLSEIFYRLYSSKTSYPLNFSGLQCNIIQDFWRFLSYRVSCIIGILMLPYMGIGREYYVFYCWRNGSDWWDYCLVFRTAIRQWINQTKIL